VLRRILGTTSDWQAPGSCLAAPVCRDWRQAASGNSGVRLLYAAGHLPSDQSFASWLTGNSRQLESFTISSSNISSMNMVLGALATAAEAAAAAGAALLLHTLRVLGAGPDLSIMARLVGNLPNLRCLQLDVRSPRTTGLLLDFMNALQQAGHLQELYFMGPPYETLSSDSFSSKSFSSYTVARQLPAGLKRFSFTPGDRHDTLPDLSHLKNLSFLHLERFLMQRGPISSKLPPGLQELEASNIPIDLADLEQEAQILTGCSEVPMWEDELELLAHFSNLKTLFYMDAGLFQLPAVCTALQQLPGLSAMEVFAQREPMQPVLSAARSYPGLRRLHLGMGRVSDPVGLAALTQLTRLLVQPFGSCEEPLQRAWVAQLCLMPWLRWLTVPSAMLAIDQAWLTGMERLQVLVVSSEEPVFGEPPPRQLLPQLVAWFEGCSPEALPPGLLLLGFSGMRPEQAAAWQVRRRLGQALGSRGCEVVFGVDLDEVANPMQQLAGVPEALQQALA
jgi:hypothetical protein